MNTPHPFSWHWFALPLTLVAFVGGFELGQHLPGSPAEPPAWERLLRDAQWSREHWPREDRLKCYRELRQEVLRLDLTPALRDRLRPALMELSDEPDGELRRLAKEMLLTVIVEHTYYPGLPEPTGRE